MAKTVSISSISSISSIRTEQHLLIRKLADCIEGIWQRYLDLSPYDLPGNLGYVEGRLEGEKLRIENRCYQSPQFRKLHLELAKVGTQLDILHCVMFPNPNYPLPMFGTDLVGGRSQISAAIADLSPTSPTHTLPSPYIQLLKALPAIDFSQPRELPKWGNIFSEFCLFIRPNGKEEEELFLSRVENYLEIHCQMALAMQPVPNEERLQIIAGQKNYCIKQRQNDKTRRVLEKAFGRKWADFYLTNVLFDFPEN